LLNVLRPRLNAVVQVGRTPLELCPPDQPVLARMLHSGRTPVGARSPSILGQQKTAGGKTAPAKSPGRSLSPESASKARRQSTSASPSSAQSKPSPRAVGGQGPQQHAPPATLPTTAAGGNEDGGNRQDAVLAPRTLDLDAEALPQAQPQVAQEELPTGPEVELQAPPEQQQEQQQQQQQQEFWKEDQECAQQHRRQQPAPVQDSLQESPAIRLGLLGAQAQQVQAQRGPLHQHQPHRAEEEQSKWHKVTYTVQNLVK
jgi:hypothetical protein